MPDDVPVQLGTGRIHIPDSRDEEFLLRAGLPPHSSYRGSRMWDATKAWYDQGRSSACVGHAWAHWLEDGPTYQPALEAAPFDIYTDAQRVDPFPGVAPESRGTTVRAGAKVLKERGLIESYHWAFSLEDTIEALLELGPVVAGTRWYKSMYRPDEQGLMPVQPDTADHQHSGHCYLLNGVDRAEELVRVKNSWGRGWGRQGHGFLRFEDLEHLIGEGGEVCIASETQKAPEPK